MPPFQRNLRILTLHQPFATLMAYGLKTNETRSWQTSYRGLVAIHAAATWQPGATALVLENKIFNAALRGLPRYPAFPVGVVLAVGTLNGITPTASYQISKHNHEYTFGDYSPGRFVWHFNAVQRLPTPIPAKGYQRLWTPDEALHAAILAPFYNDDLAKV